MTHGEPRDMAKCLVPWCIARCACASRCACAMCHCCCAKIGYSRRGYSQAHLIRPICTHDNLTAQERRTCQHFLPIFSTQQACLPVQVPLRQLRPSPAFNGEIFFCMRIENCAASILLNALRTPRPPTLPPLHGEQIYLLGFKVRVDGQNPCRNKSARPWTRHHE
jgi:hypothetical protein